MDAPRFAAVFDTLLGPGTSARLADSLSDRPAVLVAGSQLTGKSTAARAVASGLGVASHGTGSLVRAMADERGLSLEQMVVALREDPAADAAVDFRACLGVAQGTVAVLESRLAGWIGAWLRSLGRGPLFTVFLTCPDRERAIRYVRREISEPAAAELDRLLDPRDGHDFPSYLEALSRLDHPAAAVVAARLSVGQRESTDRARLQALYGVDFRDPAPCDLVVNTSQGPPAWTASRILAGARQHLKTQSF
jgi:cytidylate kinase